MFSLLAVIVFALRGCFCCDDFYCSSGSAAPPHYINFHLSAPSINLARQASENSQRARGGNGKRKAGGKAMGVGVRRVTRIARRLRKRSRLISGSQKAKKAEPRFRKVAYRSRGSHRSDSVAGESLKM